MGCNCKGMEMILAILIIVFTFVQISMSKWIILAAGIVLLLHAAMCKKCAMCDVKEEKMMPKKKVSKKKKK